MNRFSFLLEQLGIVIEQDATPRLIAQITIEREKTLARFQAENIAYRDPETHRFPPQEALSLSADKLIQEAQRKALVVGGLGGFGGLITALPESLAYLAQVYRLAQRMMLLYGLNHQDEHKIAELLIYAHQSVNENDDNWLIKQTKKQIPLFMTSIMIKQGEKLLGRRVARLLPGVGAGIGAFSSYQAVAQIGSRINRYLSQMDLGDFDLKDMEEAIEV